MDKTKVKSFVNSAASKAAAAANEKAKASSGWKRWLWAIGAIVAGAIAWFTQGCTSVTPQQVHAAHALYHAVSGEPCTIAQPAPVVVAKEK
jgi:hypothetical protein